MPVDVTAMPSRSAPLLMGLLACLIAALSGCDRRQQAASSPAKPVLAVSVFPIADLARQVAGDRWEIVTLLPPGHTPHEYSIRPGVAAALRTARVLVVVGPGLDEWAIRAGEAASGQRDVLVLTEALKISTDHVGAVADEADSPGSGDSMAADNAATAPGNDHGPATAQDHAAHVQGADEHDHPAHDDDPHIWLDPVLTERIVDAIAGVLTRHDRAGQAVYQQNAAALKKDLAALDQEYRAALAGCRTRTLVVFHPGYGYLTRRYGLTQTALLGLGGVTPGRLEQITRLIEQERIGAVYREPQYESKWVDALSRRTGTKVLVLDPLGHAGRSGHDSYFAMMRSNLAALKEGLGHGP